MYIYLDREKAKKGVAQVLGASEEKIKNYIEYFEDKAIEFIGDNIPYYITYVSELDAVRTATAEEMLEKNQRELKENEILINGKIVDYDIYSQKIVNNEIVDKTREDYINDKVITLDTEKLKARGERERDLNAVDLYDKAVLRGDIIETAKDKNERDLFRNTWLNIPNNYVDLSVPIEKLYPVPTEKIKYFM